MFNSFINNNKYPWSAPLSLGKKEEGLKHIWEQGCDRQVLGHGMQVQGRGTWVQGHGILWQWGSEPLPHR